MGFAEEVDRWVAKAERNLEQAIRKIAIEIFSRVILRTPVDTGRARANWQVSIGSVPTGTLELNDKTGTATISKVQAEALRLRAGDIIWLVNNVGYILSLESGSSKQAPQGMVKLTEQEFRPIVEQVARQINRG